jgi:hypothetical protein
MLTPVNVPPSKDEDAYTVRTIKELTHEHNVNKLDTYAPTKIWHTQKQQHLIHPTL